MYIKPPQVAQPTTPTVNNPTDEQRHQMLLNSLEAVGRIEDYEDIISLLSPPSDITRYVNPGEFKRTKVGIIGGGLAGMSAAFELRKLGYDITIFEPTTAWIGGRVYTYYFDKEKKLYGELGAMRIPISHETTWHYINLFKLNTEPFINVNPNTFIYVRDTRIRNSPENIFYKIYPFFGLAKHSLNTPWPELYSQVTKYYLSTLPPEVRRQLLIVMPQYDYRLEALQNMSLRDAMEQYGISPEGINLISSVIPTVGGLMNQSYESSLHSDYSMDFENLYTISGGMSNLPLAFYNSLTSPNPVEYPGIPQDDLGRVTWMGGFVVNGIMENAVDGKVRLRYRRETVLEDIYDSFDYVVCAIPFPMLRPADIFPLFSVQKMIAIREVAYEDAQKTLFLCRERFWEKQGIIGGSSFTDEIINVITYPQDHAHCTQSTVNCSPDEPGVIIASYNMGEDAYSLGNFEPITQYQVIRSKVEKVHGLPRWYLDINKIITGVKTIDWVREPRSAGAFQMFLPGQKRTYLYISSTPEFNNRVFFAGEHTASKNGWIQGSLWSGLKAADDVAYYSIIHRYQR